MWYSFCPQKTVMQSYLSKVPEYRVFHKKVSTWILLITLLIFNGGV